VRGSITQGVEVLLIVLSVMKVPNTKMSTRQLVDWMNTMYDTLKDQGWKYEKKDPARRLLDW
jgi:hypothetical protein